MALFMLGALRGEDLWPCQPKTGRPRKLRPINKDDRLFVKSIIPQNPRTGIDCFIGPGIQPQAKRSAGTGVLRTPETGVLICRTGSIAWTFAHAEHVGDITDRRAISRPAPMLHFVFMGAFKLH